MGDVRGRVLDELGVAGSGYAFDELLVRVEFNGSEAAFERLLFNLQRHKKVVLVDDVWQAKQVIARKISKPRAPKLKIVDVEPVDSIIFDTAVDDDDGVFGVMPLVSCDQVVDSLAFLDVLACNFEASANDVRAVMLNIKNLANQAGVVCDK